MNEAQNLTRMPARAREDDLERDIAQLARIRPTLRDGAVDLEDLGKMTGDAVMAQYEAAAKAVESMGEGLKACIKQIEATLVTCSKDMQFVAETAEMIRQKGGDTQHMMEKVALFSKATREACVDFRKNMDA